MPPSVTHPTPPPRQAAHPLSLAGLRQLCTELTGPDRHELHGTGIHLAEPVDLAGDPACAVEFLHLLQHAAGTGTPVHWTCALPPAADLAAITHLPPPAGAATGQAEAAVDQWRAAYRPGACYYRKGPGFYMIRDARGEEAARIRIAGPHPCRLFDAVTRPTRLQDLPPGSDALLSGLDARGLLIRAGDWVLLAPYRLRDWPVPYTAF